MPWMKSVIAFFNESFHKFIKKNSLPTKHAMSFLNGYFHEIERKARYLHAMNEEPDAIFV